MNIRALRNSFGLAAIILGAVASHPEAFANPLPAHVQQVASYVGQIKPENNGYDNPPELYYDTANQLHVTSRCGSFTALLFKNTYPAQVTDAALIALTGSNSPYADEWYAAINGQKSDPASGLHFTKRATVAELQAGDVLASVYTTSGDTGHVMTVGSTVLWESNITPPYTITGVAAVNKYRVNVYDSSKSVHGGYASNPYPDTRYKTEASTNEHGQTMMVDDQGVGQGTIVLYEDASNGKLVAWAWNVSPTTTSFYYNSTTLKPAGSAREVRPMVMGTLKGL